MKASTIRVAGVLVALGGIAWLLSRLVIEPQPQDTMHVIEIAGGGIFQIGLLAMLVAMRATAATGAGRGGRLVVNTGLVLTSLATLWTIITVVDLDLADTPPMLALDPAWPLSMAWLIIVGVAVLRARVWPSPVRYLPFVASFVIPAHVVASVAGLTDRQEWIAPIAYVALAYAVLGTAMARQLPSLAEQREPDARDAQATVEV